MKAWHYIVYVFLICSFIQGWMSVHPLFVIPLALMTSLIFMKIRRESVRSNPSAMPTHPMSDGIFLFALHLLIHFFAFALGYFFSYASNFQV